jgi:cell division protein ZapA
MGQVAVMVNGRSFHLSCDDGQEPRIRRLAQYIDAKVGELVRDFGQAGEARLLLMAAIVVADELSDANDALAQERNRDRAPNGQVVGAAAAGIHDLAQRIEDIAARLGSP